MKYILWPRNVLDNYKEMPFAVDLNSSTSESFRNGSLLDFRTASWIASSVNAFSLFEIPNYFSIMKSELKMQYLNSQTFMHLFHFYYNNESWPAQCTKLCYYVENSIFYVSRNVILNNLLPIFSWKLVLKKSRVETTFFLASLRKDGVDILQPDKSKRFRAKIIS